MTPPPHPDPPVPLGSHPLCAARIKGARICAPGAPKPPPPPPPPPPSKTILDPPLLRGN